MTISSANSPTSPQWRFRPSPIDGGRTGGDQAAMNFEHDIEAFVREVLQNSLDAKRPDHDFVRVEFAVERLVGPAKAAFLAAAQWPTLRKHLQAARGLAPAYAEAIPRLDSPDQPLNLLAIHDGPALGLSGDERGKGRFAMFARNKLLSDKESGSAGGSFGLGKSVLWAFSGITTVFTHSVPHGSAGTSQPRFIGIAQLPWHELAKDDFDGPGWLGIGQGEGRDAWSSSFAAPEDLLAALCLARPLTMGTGTSIVVPDFQSDRSPEELAAELARSAVKWFWPAMTGRERSLQVGIRHSGTTVDVDPTDAKELRPFLHLAGLATHPVWSPRTVTGHDALHLPAVRETMADSAGFTVHDAKEVRQAFRIDALALEDSQGDLDRHMALIRGARMVVRYVKLQSDRPAWALVRAGTAAGSSKDDALVEQFLRHAEPPSHDDWVHSAPKLHDRYKRGYVGELKGLKRRLADKAMVLLRKRDESRSDQEIPAALRKVLAVSVGATAGDGEREGRFDYRIDRCELAVVDGTPTWQFSGWVQNTREGPWEVQAVGWLECDGDQVELPVENLRVSGLFATPTEHGLRVVGSGRIPFSGACPLSAAGSLAERAVFAVMLKVRKQEALEVTA